MLFTKQMNKYSLSLPVTPLKDCQKILPLIVTILGEINLEKAHWWPFYSVFSDFPLLNSLFLKGASCVKQMMNGLCSLYLV